MKERVCFLDVDGVLADFARQAHDMCHVDSQLLRKKADWELTSSEKIGQEKLFYFCDCVDDFWRTMKPTKNASFLYNYCAEHFDRVHFLGGFCPSPEYAERFEPVKKIKEDWIKENIHGIRENSQILITPFRKEDFVDTTADCYLIDDLEKNVIAWQKAGGKAILYSTVKETIKTLHALSKKPSEQMLPTKSYMTLNFKGIQL